MELRAPVDVDMEGGAFATRDLHARERLKTKWERRYRLPFDLFESECAELKELGWEKKVAVSSPPPHSSLLSASLYTHLSPFRTTHLVHHND